MPPRVLDVNAYTTFDLIDARAIGHGWTDQSLAVLNVETPEADPGVVELQLELDHTDLEHVDAHADSVTLSPVQARRLAGELEAYAEDAELTIETDGMDEG